MSSSSARFPLKFSLIGSLSSSRCLWKVFKLSEKIQSKEETSSYLNSKLARQEIRHLKVERVRLDVGQHPGKNSERRRSE